KRALNEPIGNPATHHEITEQDGTQNERIAACESKLGYRRVETECGHRRCEQNDIEGTKCRDGTCRQSQVRMDDGNDDECDREPRQTRRRSDLAGLRFAWCKPPKHD